MIRQVRLELARCEDFPEGSPDHGYELHLPLAPDGHIDHHWLKQREEGVFRRFWGGEEEQGRLRHGRNDWMLSFGKGEDDEVTFRADAHRFVEGEYISIRERDGVTRTFRVAAVR